jgi:hypothetical protein
MPNPFKKKGAAKPKPKAKAKPKEYEEMPSLFADSPKKVKKFVVPMAEAKD